VASRFTHLLRTAKLLAPLHRSDRLPGQRGLLHPGFQRGWSSFPLLDMTTTVTGLLLLAGLSPAGTAASLASLHVLDHLVRRGQQRFWDGEAKHLGRPWSANTIHQKVPSADCKSRRHA
jgi:hypothetical protein